MNDIGIEDNPRETSLSVSNWQKEVHAGRESLFLCVYHDRFGFGMSLEQVKEVVGKLDALLAGDHVPSPVGEIQVDRSGTNDGLVMVAFRPPMSHSGRYFDFPESAARDLVAGLRERLLNTKP